MTTLALDVGGTKTLVALVDGDAVVAQARLDTDLGGGAEALFAAVATRVAGWRGRYDAVGAAVTGVVREGLWSALNPGTLDVPDGFPIVATLERAFGAPAVAVNDAQAAAWGEWAYGAGARQDVVFLTVSTGIGGGAVIGGRLLGGLSGSFGQFVDERGARLEDGCSGRWIARAAAEAGHALDAAGVFARAGESWAEAILSTGARRVAALCRNVQFALDPARIVVGGGVGLAEGYLDRLRAALAEAPERVRPRLAPAALGPLAGIVGVAALARDAMEPHKHRETAK